MSSGVRLATTSFISCACDRCACPAECPTSAGPCSSAIGRQSAARRPPHQIQAVARPARRRLALDDLVADDLHAAGRDQVLALPDAAGRHVRDKPRMRVAQRLGLLLVFGHLDDPAGDRLGASPASPARNRLPAIRVFGTISVSTTRIHGVHLIAAKYSAASFTSSSVIAFARSIIVFVFGFRGSAV